MRTWRAFIALATALVAALGVGGGACAQGAVAPRGEAFRFVPTVWDH